MSSARTTYPWMLLKLVHAHSLHLPATGCCISVLCSTHADPYWRGGCCGRLGIRPDETYSPRGTPRRDRWRRRARVSFAAIHGCLLLQFNVCFFFYLLAVLTTVSPASRTATRGPAWNYQRLPPCKILRPAEKWLWLQRSLPYSCIAATFSANLRRTTRTCK